MGRQYTQDPTDVSDAIEALDHMQPRLHNDRNTNVRSCRCGALVVVPEGHAADDDDTDLLCHDCDKPIGLKVYEALIKH